jgi:hypothetical protein
MTNKKRHQMAVWWRGMTVACVTTRASRMIAVWVCFTREMCVSTQKAVTFIRNGNMLVLDPPTDAIFVIAKSVLQYTIKKKHMGYDAVLRRQEGLSPIEIEHRHLFDTDYLGRVATNFGFWDRLKKAFVKHGYSVTLHEPVPYRREIFRPCYENVARYRLRAGGQREFLQKVLSSRCGRITCPPGFGKSFMLGIVAALLPRAQIDIVTKNVSVLRDRIYPQLVSMVGDVGIVGGGRRSTGRRVMCYTADSVGHSPATADMLFGDECHQLAADRVSEALVRWQNSRNFGLSASNDMRWDGKDVRVEGIFGPVIFEVKYDEAVDSGMVVPLRVYWSSVKMAASPSCSENLTVKKRQCIWRNDFRNRIIAADARRYDANTQVLITTETVDHVMHLKKYLPEFTAMYNSNSFGREQARRVCGVWLLQPG